MHKRLEALRRAMQDPDVSVRHAAVRSLSATEQALDVDRLVRLAHDGKKQARLRAIYALGELRGARVAEALGGLVRQDADSEIRAAAASSLVAFGTGASEHLRAALSDHDQSVAEEAIRALARLGSPESVEWIIGAARQREGLREAAIEALAAMGRNCARGYPSDGHDAAAFLSECMREGSLEQRCAAVQALACLSPEVAQAPLIAATAAEHAALRRSAVEALGKLPPSEDGACPQ